MFMSIKGKISEHGIEGGYSAFQLKKSSVCFKCAYCEQYANGKCKGLLEWHYADCKKRGKRYVKFQTTL